MPDLNPDVVDRALAEATKRAANLDYFFDALSSPTWIGPLAERGLFSEPPPQTVTDEGYILAPPWSASRYLARMAALAPAEVLTVILSVTTDNERVHQDFIDAALDMPVGEAGAIAASEAAWIAGRERIYYLRSERVVELAALLAGAGESDTAIALLRSIAALSDSPRDAGLGLKHAVPRVADWEYDRILRQVVERVLPLAPSDTLRELTVLLGQALDLVRLEDGVSSEADWRSRVWRPRVANDRDRSARAEDALISGLRDAARAARVGRVLSDSDLVALLTPRTDEIFRRIAMDALAYGPEPDVEVVRSLVVDPEALTSAEPSVEFRELLSSNASRLSRSDVEGLVEAVRAGPDTERYRDRESRGRRVTDEEVEQYVAWWRAARLKLLLDGLDATERTEYEALTSVAGEAELPVSFEVRTSYGDTSPLTVEELADLDDAEIIERLRTWEPEGSWAEPSVEGFARTLSVFVQKHPDRVSKLASGLRDVRPAFVQWTLEGLEAALREGKLIDWTPVLDLMSWVVEQPRELPEGRGDRYSDLEPGWVSTRRATVSLLQRGLELEGDAAIDVAHRRQVWSVIRAVAADPDPTPENEERYGGTNMDPLTLALNTTRPRALFAAAAYGLWLHRAAQASPPEEGLSFRLFHEAPELGELLEEHLDPAADPSVAVRATIGDLYANLFVLDTEWTREHTDAIFPSDDSPLREAGWGAYVIYTSPYDNVLSALRAVYERSAQLAGEPGHGFRWDTTPQVKLGEHLVTFYWRGTIGLLERPLLTYWQNASTETRREVIDFLGRSVKEVPALEEDVQTRLLAFWDFAETRATRAETVDELAPFAWWFGARELPAQWRLDRLLGLLLKNVKPDPAFAVIEELPAVATQEPRGAVEALRRLLELEQERWSIDSWREQIMGVLRRALEQPDLETRRAAEETAHWLGALGYGDYRVLVE